jgi:hypothetical protein
VHVHGVARPARLQGHDGEAVRDSIVQFAGQPGTFRGDRLRRHLFGAVGRGEGAFGVYPHGCGDAPYQDAVEHVREGGTVAVERIQ